MDHRSIADGSPETRIVYIRAVEADSIPAEARARVGDTPLYGIHDASGARLALVADRKLAFAVARQHDMTPVSAH